MPTITTAFTRTILFTSRRATEALDELNRLESLYLASIRRKRVALLLSSGPSDYSVVAYSRPGQEDEVVWLRANVKEGQV
jgi:hypothetical protein